MLTISPDSFHYKAFKWFYKIWEMPWKEPTNLCSYFWTIFIGVPVTVLLYYIIVPLSYCFIIKPYDFLIKPLAKKTGFVILNFIPVLKQLKHLKYLLYPFKIFTPVINFMDIYSEELISGLIVIFLLLCLSGISFGIYNLQDKEGWWALGIIGIIFGSIILAVAVFIGIIRLYGKLESTTTINSTPKPKKIKGTPFYKLMWAFIKAKKKKLCPIITVAEESYKVHR